MPELLNAEEQALISQLGFEVDILELLKARLGSGQIKQIEVFEEWDARKDIFVEALVLRLDKPLIPAFDYDFRKTLALFRSSEWIQVASLLRPTGYQLFFFGQNPALVKGHNSRDIIRILKTAGANQGVDNTKVLDQLSAWQSQSQFTVISANGQGFSLDFLSLPINRERFIQEARTFCPEVNNVLHDLDVLEKLWGKSVKSTQVLADLSEEDWNYWLHRFLEEYQYLSFWWD
ncbi:MAG: DUF4253 domain-containing protein [Bacteroidota bacterium]